MRTFVVDAPRSRALRALNYSPAVERIRLVGSRSARPLRELVKSFGPAYGTVFTRLDCSPEHGIELLSQSDMFAIDPRGRIIRRDSMREPDKHLIRPGHVLIAGAGTLGENELYGRAIRADERLVGKYVGPDSMTLVFEDPEDDFSLFAYAWLATPTGTQAIRSTSYGTKLLRFRQDLLSSLPVPVPKGSTVQAVAELVRSSTRERERFARELRAAHRVISDLPEVSEATSAHARTGIRTARWEGPLHTLRAWNHVFSGRALAVLSALGRARVRDWLRAGESLFHGLLRVRTWCTNPHGYDLASQRDVFSVVRIPRRLQHPGCPDHAFFSPQEGILIASRGQLGRSNLFGRAELGMSLGPKTGVSQDMLRVVPLKSHLEVMFAFLSHPIGLSLTQGTAVGTSIPIIHTGLFKELPVPDVGASTRDLIASHVVAAYAARRAADDAHAAAINIIEAEVLPAWLN